MAGFVSDVLVEVAKILTAVGVIVAALKGASKLRPVQWFFRKNVSEPLSHWTAATIDRSPALAEMREDIASIRLEFQANGGGTIKDVALAAAADAAAAAEDAKAARADAAAALEQSRTNAATAAPPAPKPAPAPAAAPSTTPPAKPRKRR